MPPQGLVPFTVHRDWCTPTSTYSVGRANPFLWKKLGNNKRDWQMASVPIRFEKIVPGALFADRGELL